jgi:RHS repeat-associated protein
MVCACAVALGGCNGCNGNPPLPSPPPLDHSVATSLADAAGFLYSGDNPIQTGVAPGTIDRTRIAVLRGRVIDQKGNPVGGVIVSVMSHAEFGQTKTRTDGQFDFAVNGGAPLTLVFESGLSPTLHRQVATPWLDFVLLDDIVVTTLDSAVTPVDFSSMPQPLVARGSPVTDDSGTRQATLVFGAGTTAMMQMPGGTMAPLGSAHVRATEYTVGKNGVGAMPALLPSNSGYTYAVELSVDEAQKAKASRVEFNQPVSYYVENFLGFPVGTDVPAGYYDRARGLWVPSDNGKIIGVVSVTAGLADIDSDGDGAADSALGMDDAERRQLAMLYKPGASLWRVPIRHFSGWDFNWGFGPPDGADGYFADSATDANSDDPCNTSGSIIECQNQILGENVGVPGTPFFLSYRSDRVPGRKAAYTVTIPLSGATLPSTPPERIDLEVDVAGNKFTKSFPPSTNLSYDFTWNGSNAYGQVPQGSQPITVRTGYTYKGSYSLTSKFGENGNGADISGDKTRQEVTIWNTWRGGIGPWDARSVGLGGWSLSAHHSYDVNARTVYLGDGRRRSARSLGKIIETLTGIGTLPYVEGGEARNALVDVGHGVAVGPDGNVYFSDTSSNVVRRIDPAGKIWTFAGNGMTASTGDEGPAINASLNFPGGLSFGADGSLYIIEEGGFRVRRVDPARNIHPFAGDGSAASGGDGGPATAAQVQARGIVAAPDGSVYLAEPLTSRIRRVTTDGNIETVLAADLANPLAVAIHPINGDLYVADTEHQRVLRVPSKGGGLITVAGNGTAGYSGDGGYGPNAELSGPAGLAFAPDGTLYVSTPTSSVVRAVDPDGYISTVVGSVGGLLGDEGPAENAQLFEPASLAVGPDGTLFLGDQFRNLVRRVRPALPGLALSNIVIPEEDGSLVYVFDGSGRHTKTLDGLTGVPLYTFDYFELHFKWSVSFRINDGPWSTSVMDVDVKTLRSITGANNQVTTIERDPQGVAHAIVSPYGVRTTLTYDQNGWLASLQNQAKESVVLASSADGLLRQLTDPLQHVHTFDYEPDTGRLKKDSDPEGGSTTLARTQSAPGVFSVTRTSALGRSAQFAVGHIPSRDGQRNTITDSAGLVSTSDVGADGTTTTNYPDGMQATLSAAPEPRFGMLAAVPMTSTLRLPSGLVLQQTASRVLSPADGTDPFGYDTLTDISTINGHTFTRVFDRNAKTITITTPMGRQATTTLDDLGRISQAQLPGVDAIKWSYDSNGRLQTTTQGARTLTLGYDGSGFLAGVTDSLMRQIAFDYDAVGRPKTITRTDKGQVLIGSDASSNLRSVTPPGRPVHQLTYDKIDALATYTPPDVGEGKQLTQFKNNVDWQPQLVTRADGSTVGFMYEEPIGRLSQITTATGAYSVTYDPVTGDPKHLTGPDGSLDFVFDGPLLTDVTASGAVSGKVHHDFDAGLQLVGETINGADGVTWIYDADGLLTTAGALTLTRDPSSGLLSGTTLGQASDSLTYDEYGAPQTYQASYGVINQLSFTYTPDELGRIHVVTENIVGTAHTREYDYDAAGRLQTVKLDGAVAQTYGYDANDNRTAVGGAMVATYDAQDRLKKYGSATCSYTPNGELKQKQDGTQTTTYVHDGIGRLSSVKLPDGRTIDYVFDAAGRRIARKLNGGVVQAFLYGDALHVIAELDAANNVVSRFVYGSRPNVPDYFVKAGVTYRIWSDHLGSPRLVVDISTGTAAERIDYDEFGGIVQDTNPTLQPFKYAGGLYDADTGLTHFGVREYDASIGRWIEKDPLGIGGTTNLYTYVYGDPINFRDPIGLWSWPSARDSFLAGYADFVTGGFTTAFAQQVNIGGVVDPCYASNTTAFNAGKYAAVLGAVILPFLGAGEAGAGGGAGAALPELEISASKYPDLAENISNAIEAGHPDVLTHGGDVAANRAAALADVPNIPGLSRDEFPFASSMEGGEGAWVGHIPPAQQNAQGGLISNFLRANGILPGMQYRVVIVP